jgi:hypothetical protein
MPTERKITPLLAIRHHCVACSGGVHREVRECVIIDCPLYEYRMGKNPHRSENHKSADTTISKGTPDA